MAYGRKNHVKVDPTSYSFMLLGEPKCGKTTVMKEALEIMDCNYMFAELGRERGADAIEGINCINCPSWSQDYNEDDNSIGWSELVDDICENPEDYNLKVLIIDTYDQYITIAEDEALRLWNRENPDKRAKTLNASWGGFGAGSKKAIELMFEQIDRLNEVGVKVWWIGHVRNKSVTDIATGDTYEVLSSDQQQNYFNALKKNLHFLGLAFIDREIVKEKSGKRNIVTKKEEEKAVVKEETRKIKFRDDSYVIDCGSRFKNIIDTIDLDASQLVNAMTEAIRSEIEGSGASVETRKKAEEAAEVKRTKEIAKNVAKKKEEANLEDMITKITDYVKANKGNMDAVKPLLAKAKELGYSNPTQVDTIEAAKEILALI